jgi:hypothetical protein
MNVEQFLSLLEANPDQTLRIVLPDGQTIPVHFHITEVGHVSKNFMDCGGTRRKTESCMLQTWVFLDLHHRLSSSKLANILRMAGDVLPSLDLPVEIEHEAGVVSQYPVTAGSRPYLDLDHKPQTHRLLGDGPVLRTRNPCGCRPYHPHRHC